MANTTQTFKQMSRPQYHRVRVVTLFCLILLSSLTSSAAYATTYYVDAVNGRDRYTGLDTSHAWKTTTKAANTAVAGDTVLFMPGTYANPLKPVNSGTSGHMITFKAQTRRMAIINGNLASSNGVDLTKRSYIRIEGFEITGWNWEKMYFVGSDHLEIVDNYIHGAGDTGIKGHYTTINTNILIEGNELYNLGERGIHVTGNGIIIRNNIIHHNENDGINGGGDNWLVEGNLLYDSFQTDKHQDGMDLGKLSNSTIRNNVLYDYTQLIYFSLINEPNQTYTNVDIYGNILYNDRYWTVQGGICPGISIRAIGNRGYHQIVKNIKIHSNTFGWLGMSAIAIENSDVTATFDGFKIYDNIFYGDAGYVSATYPVTNVVSNYNLFNVGVSKPSFEGANSITADPGFVDYQVHSAWNFHLKTNSPAINAGNPSLASVVTLPSPFLDIDRTSRPIDGFDIGAYKYISAPADLCLIGYWKFDEGTGQTALDSSGNANNGTLVGSPPWVTGKFSSALSFATTDQTVEIPTKGMSLSGGTITLWANPANFLSTAQFLFGHVDSTWGNRIQIYTESTQGSLGIGLGDNHSKQTNIYNLPKNTWTHIALTWNGTSYVVYINGAQSATGTYTGLTTLSTYADISNTGNRSDRHEAFNGIIDDVHIYNRALSTIEITDVYQSISDFAFYPIGAKQVNEGQTLTFAVQPVSPSTQIQLADNNLPSQSTFANNTFSWTPGYNAAGSYEATFVAPAGQLEDFETITITVNNINRKPVLIPIADKDVNETQTLAFRVRALDPDGDTVIYTAQNLPAGATFTGNLFTWAPSYSQAGNYQVSFIASDGNLQDSQTVTITVNNIHSPLELGLVGYWKFDTGTGLDSSGMGNTGTFIYQPTLTTGKFGSTILFNSLNQAVEIPTNGMKLASGTIAMWVYPTSFPSVDQFMFSHVDSSWGSRIQIYTNNTSGALGIGLGDTHERLNNIYNLPKNIWTHIALTWDGTYYVIYVNGTERAIGRYTGLNTLSRYADIGNTGNRPDRNGALMGSVDEVQVYNYVLTASEILDVYSYQP